MADEQIITGQSDLQMSFSKSMNQAEIGKSDALPLPFPYFIDLLMSLYYDTKGAVVAEAFVI